MYFRYYPALKTLEELEHLHLPHVANYRFSKQLQRNIPKLVRQNYVNMKCIPMYNDFINQKKLQCIFQITLKVKNFWEKYQNSDYLLLRN